MTQFVQREDGQYVVVVKQLGVPDRNGLVWSKEVMERALANRRFAGRLEHGNMLGELGQPRRYAGQSHADFEQRVSTIQYDNVGCSISDVRINDENQLVAIVKPAGRWQGSVEQMLADQVPLTLGMRAFVDENAKGEVVSASIVTFDVIDSQ